MVERTTKFKTPVHGIKAKTSRLVAFFHNDSEDNSDMSYRNIYELLHDFLSSEQDQEATVAVALPSYLDPKIVRKAFEVQLQKRETWKVETFARDVPAGQKRKQISMKV